MEISWIGMEWGAESNKSIVYRHSLIDILKIKNGEFFISDWLRNRNTVEVGNRYIILILIMANSL